MTKTVTAIICLFCEKIMGLKDVEGVEGDSHSICEACWSKEYPDYDGPYPEEEYHV